MGVEGIPVDGALGVGNGGIGQAAVACETEDGKWGNVHYNVQNISIALQSMNHGWRGVSG